MNVAIKKLKGGYRITMITPSAYTVINIKKDRVQIPGEHDRDLDMTADEAIEIGALLNAAGEAAKQLAAGSDQTVLDLFRECLV